MVLSGPENIDLLVFGVIVGSLAPILSVIVASTLSSSLSSVVQSISYPASKYGIDAGLTSRLPPGRGHSEERAGSGK
jgi:NAD/NADP transhydrogenase beta subunit